MQRPLVVPPEFSAAAATGARDLASRTGVDPRQNVVERLQRLFADLSGLDGRQPRLSNRALLELGLDSLFLTQASTACRRPSDER